MDKFHPRGSHSCKPTQSIAEASITLSELSSSAVLQTILDALKPAQLFLVGGAVRDAFFSRLSTDIDLTTNLTVEEVRSRCLAHGLRVIETGIQHGTVLIVVNNMHVEITTFRQPADRNTQMDAHDITVDLSGRDFTINAIAFCVSSHQFVDVCHGIPDLQSMLIRAVGNPHSRFQEDPLRILRMIRFGPAQGRSIDATTLEAATQLTPLLERISVERIRNELEQILISPCPAAGFIHLRDIGALPWTIPELIPTIGFEQNRYHIHDVFDHTMSVLDRTPPDRILRWTAIFHDLGKPHTLSIDEGGERHFYLHELESTTLSWKRMEHLKFSHDDMKTISLLVRQHMRPMTCGPAGARRIIRDLGEQLALWRAFKDADTPPTMPQEEIEKIAHDFDSLIESEQKKMAIPSYGRLAVNGNDLRALGIQPGPTMGRILKQLEEVIIENPQQNSRASLLQIAKKLVESAGK